jgi:hypothetical protein
VERSLEVGAGAGGDRVAGQFAQANGTEAGPVDESGTAAEREKSLDG